MYPVFLPLLVAISISSASAGVFLPNVVLSLSSLPRQMIPTTDIRSNLDGLHWLLTLVPFHSLDVLTVASHEGLTLLYPLHVFTACTIEFLATTSLDPAERHLLATTLIDLYLFAQSPQSQILKILLWHGTLLLFILCRWSLQAELSLARMPPWRFRESQFRQRSSTNALQNQDQRLCFKLLQLVAGWKARPDYNSGDDEGALPASSEGKVTSNMSIDIKRLIRHPTMNILQPTQTSGSHLNMGSQRSGSMGPRASDRISPTKRRHTLPVSTDPRTERPRTTPSGRPKRLLTIGQQSLLGLTPAQAAVRKWGYAAFTFAALTFIILGPINHQVRKLSLRGQEPLGWALGYVFGNMPRFRPWLQSNELGEWISLPEPSPQSDRESVGWAEWYRLDIIGAANTRLLICSYCLVVLLVGLSTVHNLSSRAEVDTRRKVFHGMMVAILFPTVFVDPCFISLALILVLAAFLLLDLFRACQVPPISRPLTSFLAPYVDGRDHRGPVIVSHIFLLFGCAMPLWLSLAGVPRTGEGPWTGWEVDGRSINMISGVVCVGMGDSAASLIGRRYGRHKWYWGGDKSLEGSLGFTIAVTVGLVAAYIWLRIGGWASYQGGSLLLVCGKSLLAASGTSMTEAVLTGANDNVVVPVVLWLLVRGLGL
jgi:dolichol kinase